MLHCWAMISKLLPFVLIVGTAAARAQMAPDAPDKLKPPAGEQVVFQAHATGVQIYTCQQSADAKYGWILKGPEAELHDEHGAVVGRHFAGPTWKHNDGSEVMGKMTAKVDAPEGNSIPWLLLSATSHNGEGVFSKVTSIQRLHTRGGKAPADSECTAAKVSAETRSDYAADYYFFAPGNGSSAGPEAPGKPAFTAVSIEGPAPSNPRQGTPSPQRIRVSAGVMQGLLVSKVNPEYPPEAKDRHIDGEVLLKVNVDKEGNVYKVEPESGDPLLAASAMDAVKQWKYRPFLLNGQTVEVESTVKINFSLAP